MVSVPVRALMLWTFGATEKATRLLPLPLGFEVMAIRGSPLATVQPHPGGRSHATALAPRGQNMSFVFAAIGHGLHGHREAVLHPKVLVLLDRWRG